MRINDTAARIDAINRRYAEIYGFERSSDWLMLKLQEEFGELAEAYLRFTGRQRDKGDRTANEQDAHERFALELADTTGLLLALSQQEGVDLERAIDAKWLVWDRREHQRDDELTDAERAMPSETYRGGVEIVRDRDPEAVRRIIAGLPSWFGTPAANEHYVTAASERDSFLARVDGETVGVLLADRSFPESGEIHFIAVDAGHRGAGVGRMLVDAFEAQLRASEARLVQVKTVGPSFEDEGYAATREFYAALGFLPVEEVDNLDWDGPTLIMVKPL